MSKRTTDRERLATDKARQGATGARPLESANETSRATESARVRSGPLASLPKSFGRYSIKKMLGTGAMGAVYLAQDEALDRPVALKVARSSSTGSSNTLKRLSIEAKSAAKIDHPFICKVYDAGEIEGIRFIAMQYIKGEDLRHYMKRRGRKRKPAVALRLIRQLAEAMNAAHEAGVIHRDLKPENILLNRRGEPIITDFGLARQSVLPEDARLTVAGTMLGSVAYMSPEQANGEVAAFQSDIYALGVILFEMLTGHWPFSGSPYEIGYLKCTRESPSPLTLDPTIPPGLADICSRLLAKRKTDRIQSCSELVRELEGINLSDWHPSIRLSSDQSNPGDNHEQCPLQQTPSSIEVASPQTSEVASWGEDSFITDNEWVPAYSAHLNRNHSSDVRTVLLCTILVMILVGAFAVGTARIPRTIGRLIISDLGRSVSKPDSPLLCLHQQVYGSKSMESRFMDQFREDHSGIKNRYSLG